MKQGQDLQNFLNNLYSGNVAPLPQEQHPEAMPQNYAHKAQERKMPCIDEQQLLELYVKCTTVAEQLKALDEFPEQMNALQRLRDRIADLFDRQRQLQQGESIVNIAVIGDFSSGKSTFINSLLGKELCPTSDKPTTSSITKFRYGDTLSFRQTNKNWQALKNNSNSGSLSWEKYMELAQHGDKKQSKGLYFECLCPTEELRNIALYDTPGFNNSDSIRGARDTKLTQTMLESADVILLLMDINTGSIGADMVNKLRRLHAQSKKLYLILNKADLKAPSKRTAILTQCTNDFPYFEKTSWYSAIEELEGCKPKFAQNDKIPTPAHIFSMKQDTESFTFTNKIKKTDFKFAEEFASLIENKDQEYHFIFSNAPTGNDTGFFLLRAEPAKRSENRQKLFEWFLDIKKEKEKLTQKAFYERCGEWSHQAKEVLQRLKTILRTSAKQTNTKPKTDYDKIQEKVRNEFWELANKKIDNLNLETVFVQSLRDTVNCYPSKKSYVFSPYWILHITDEEWKRIASDIYNHLKKFFIELVKYLSWIIHPYYSFLADYLNYDIGYLSFLQNEETIKYDIQRTLYNSWIWQHYAYNDGAHYDSEPDAQNGKKNFFKAIESDAKTYIFASLRGFINSCDSMLGQILNIWDEENAYDQAKNEQIEKYQNEQTQNIIKYVDNVMHLVESLHG